MNEQELRHAIKTATLCYLNVPYRHLGWGPKFFDCIGLIVRVGWDLGILAEDIDPVFRSYSTNPDPEHMKAGLDRYLDRLIPSSTAGVGDVFWFRDRRRYSDAHTSPMHVGIITRKDPAATYVAHACLPKPHEKVVQSRITGKFIVGAWRYRGLTLLCS